MWEAESIGTAEGRTSFNGVGNPNYHAGTTEIRFCVCVENQRRVSLPSQVEDQLGSGAIRDVGKSQGTVSVHSPTSGRILRISSVELVTDFDEGAGLGFIQKAQSQKALTD